MCYFFAHDCLLISTKKSMVFLISLDVQSDLAAFEVCKLNDSFSINALGFTTRTYKLCSEEIPEEHNHLKVRPFYL